MTGTAENPLPIDGFVTYGVGGDSPIKRLWILGSDLDNTFTLHADTTLPARSFAPAVCADDEKWIAENLAEYLRYMPEFMRSSFELDGCVGDNADGSRETLWDENGDLWFTGYVYHDGALSTEGEAYELALSATRIADVTKSTPYIGYLYREHLGGIWARGGYTEPAGTVAPSQEIADVLRSSLAANAEDMIGFDAWSSTLNPDQDEAVTQIITAATTHPKIIEFDGLGLSEDSDDRDTVNEIAYAVVSDTLTRLGFTGHPHD